MEWLAVLELSVSIVGLWMDHNETSAKKQSIGSYEAIIRQIDLIDFCRRNGNNNQARDLYKDLVETIKRSPYRKHFTITTDKSGEIEKIESNEVDENLILYSQYNGGVF